MSEHLIELIGVLLTAAAVIWRGGVLVGKMQSMVDELKSAIRRWEEDRDKIAKIDVHDTELGNLKAAVTEQTSRMQAVWTKLFSHDKHIAVQEERTAHLSGSDLTRFKPPGE